MKEQRNFFDEVCRKQTKKIRAARRFTKLIGLHSLLAAIAVFPLMSALPGTAQAADFPASGWHRGDVAVAQENSRKAIVAAFRSPSPNIEVDVLDFIDAQGNRVGLLAHDYKMGRITGIEGKFFQYTDVSSLPPNSADPKLAPEPFMTVIDLFELIKESKAHGVVPIVSLDMKEEGATGKEFGAWIGELIKKYGFQDHVFASSFFKSNVVGVNSSCPECMTGGLVFNDHYALKHLDYHHTSLDLTKFSQLTFFLGFLGKKTFPHDFVLIQDDIMFSHPELVDYWKNERKVSFVGVFVYDKDRPYTEKEWKVLKKVDWLELDPTQMQQKLNTK